jgi:hypothetical protein
MTYLGSPKELITPREGSRHQSLRANRDVFVSQHVNSHGSPKELTESTGNIYFSLANSSTTLFYWFTTGIMHKFAEGASLPYFQ